MTVKGKELSEYREKHGIRFQSELMDDENEEGQQQSNSKSTNENPEAKSASEADAPQSSGVLIGQ